MTTKTIPQHEKIAREFSKVLREWLTAEQMAQVISRNAKETNPSICHSHDFCDANMAMMEAYEKVTGEEIDNLTEEQSALWGKAWDHAVKTKFRVTR